MLQGVGAQETVVEVSIPQARQGHTCTAWLMVRMACIAAK